MKKVLKHLKENWIRHGFETFVVTIGILGAFALNNWNEESKERKLVLSHYQELRDDLNNDLISINLAVDTVRITEKLSLYVYHFLTSRLQEVDSAKLKMAFISAERYAFFSRSKNAYSNLVSSGNIHLISNKELKGRLGNYHDNDKWFWVVHNSKLKQTLEEYGRYIHHFTDPLLVRNFYADYFEFIEIDSLDSVVPFETLPIDWEKVKADPRYLALLSDVMAQRIFQLSFYGRLRKEIEELLLVLNSEIERIQ
jgi:hypothetical protein